MEQNIKLAFWCLFIISASTLSKTHAKIEVSANGRFVQDSDCGLTKTCFSDCTADTGCTYEAACLPAGGVATCTLTVKETSTEDSWFALGFSTDQKMGDDSVTGCKRRNGQFSVFNVKNGDTVVELPTDGVQLTDSDSRDGFLRCTFTREMAEGLSGDRFDLSKSWFWLIAKGPLDGEGKLQYHTPSGRFFSPEAAVL